MNKLVLIVICLIVSFSSCKDAKEHKDVKIKAKQATIESKFEYVNEPHSFAKPNEAVTKHLDLDIKVDFSKKVITGQAKYQIEHNNAKTITLDTKYLKIDKVQENGKDAKYALGKFNELLGKPLVIDIKEETKTITVFYRTTEKTEALQWLDPQQTADKAHPFLFTQGQAILTRTWIPIQDSPQIRITYNATVQVPKELMAVMSAENPKEKSENGTYHFRMQQPISSYLIALAVGDVEYRSISDRTGVYAEKTMIDKVHFEFSDMEKMVTSAEALYGKYAWDQFDVIVLPPSFPFGGMENPRLTFATPTVIAGDKSLTSLIAHELAHSWSGNLVTNATWDDFWLNEGFTVYFEMRIMEALYGKERADMLALIGGQDLEEELEALKDTPNDTKLKLNLKGRNPDDGMNSIAYDKGYLFLRSLEEAVGRERFDVFLKGYFDKHAFSTIYTEKFIDYLKTHLLDKHKVAFNVDEWVYKAGLPTNRAIVTSSKFDNVEKAIKQFVSNNRVDKQLTKNWTTQEWVHFVRNLPMDIQVKQMKMLDNAFDFSHANNSYIAMVWYDQSVNHNYHGNGVDKEIEDFLTNVGRRWYVSTIYRAFKKSGRGEEGLAIYKKARSNYHSVTANTVDAILEYDASL